jgi:hypothetical protein
MPSCQNGSRKRDAERLEPDQEKGWNEADPREAIERIELSYLAERRRWDE